ncbi:MAG: leucyl/phenylalanyl-tRNA--protein transferase [Armatimonadetes bacterium]|nr:leucyl/phenylalanyl-tRNA--protein transferase [Armatimonadota bacterium]
MFPPVERADEDGVLCWGGVLSPTTLRHAYCGGIFPWPHRGAPLLWFAPPQRALLFCDEFHVGSRLRRFLGRNPFEIRVDTAFGEVMRGCAAPRRGESGTWINAAMLRAYGQLHEMGHAHSIEAWRDGQLVGGLYGVSFGAYFCGESMFFRESNASKAALIWLVEHLQSRGASWLDCQMMTPHFAQFGAREVERSEFMRLLRMALSQENGLF